MTEGGPGFSLRSVGRSALILGGGSAAVQVLGVVRELFVAAQVGLSPELDALLIALVLPITLSGVLTSGTVTALVPAYLEVRREEGLMAARRLGGAVLTSVGLMAILLAVALALFSAVAVTVTGPGLSQGSRTEAVGYLRLLAPVAFLAAVSGILTGICQAEERFRSIAIATFVGPAVTLLVLFSTWGSLGLQAYALGSLLGPLVTVIVLLVTVQRAGLMPLPTLRWRDPGLVAFVRHAWPLTLSSAILQLNFVADRAIASLLLPGAVSALRFGEVLIRTPVVAIAPAWGAAMYPAQVRAAAGGSGRGLGVATGRSVAYALAAFVPLAIIMASVAPLAVSVVYARGAFGAADVQLTASVVAAFAPLIVILMVAPTLGGALNARRKGTILLAAGSMNVVLNFALDVVLGAWLGVAGVALSSSVTSTVVVLFLAFQVARRESDFVIQPLVATVLRVAVATLLPALPVAALVWGGVVDGGTPVGWMLLIGIGTFILVAYVVIATRLRVQEVGAAIDLVRERLAGRLRRRPS